MSALEISPGRGGPRRRTSALTRRYDRLLAFYPRDHRDVHRSEMLGVLLAASRPDQSWPDPGDAADLIRGAALIRARRAFGPESAPHWRDAVAIVGVIGGFLMLVQSGPVLANLLYEPWGGQTRGAVHALSVVWLIVAPWMAFAVLRGHRRLAVAGAGALTLTQVGFTVAFAIERPTVSVGLQYGHIWQLVDPAVVLVLPVLTTLALMLTPNPHRGITLIGDWRLLRWSAIIVVLQVLALTTWMFPPGQAVRFAAIYCVVAWAGAVALQTAIGRRATLLLALPVLAFVGIDWMVEIHTEGNWQIALPILAAPLALFILLLAWSARSRQHDASPPEEHRAGRSSA